MLSVIEAIFEPKRQHACHRVIEMENKLLVARGYREGVGQERKELTVAMKG